MNKIIEKWIKTGLLEELTESNIEPCANLLEDMGKLLISKQDANDSYNTEHWLNAKETKLEFFAGTLLSICRRLFNGNLPLRIPTAQQLYDDYNSFLIKNNFDFACADDDTDLKIVADYMKQLK